MIKKSRTIPIKIQKLEALERRTPSFHPKKSFILDELSRRRSGYKGEKSLDYHLSFLLDRPYHILHGLRLLNQHNKYFQIDTLILTPFFIPIIEAKNYGGTITFDNQFHQLIQQNVEIERAYEDPVVQVKRHQLQLKGWLKQNKFPNIPILPLVVISNPSTVIKTIGNPKNYPHITKSINLIFEIEKYEKIYKNEILTKKELTKLSKLLVKKHTPEEDDVLHRFKIDKNELLTGVQCPSCFFIPMNRVHGNWLCPSCHGYSKTAHLAALRDYALLISPTITNRDLRNFLQLPSRTIATNIITLLNLPGTGKGKARKYELSKLLLDSSL
ncbi:nuclease-related domain-containing protein [Heyndrickxia sp. NPDC080065]|uniref:nuclease-related domain-containing protein n=1 Tax=Heyndrickxia sp. NPDC080065 TaxID=3390568 RepID=UPI003CFFFEF6